MVPLPDSATVRISDAVVFRDIEGEAVVLNLTTGIYFGLNEVGTRIWHLAGELGSYDAICARIGEEFDVDGPTVSRDVAALLSELAERGLIEIGSA